MTELEEGGQVLEPAAAEPVVEPVAIEEPKTPEIPQEDQDAYVIGRAMQLGFIPKGQETVKQSPTIPGTNQPLPDNWDDLDDIAQRALANIVQGQEAQMARQLDERDQRLLQQMAPVIRESTISSLSSGLDRKVVETVIQEIERDTGAAISSSLSPTLANLIRDAAVTRQSRSAVRPSVADTTKGSPGPMLDSEEQDYINAYKAAKGRTPSAENIAAWRSLNG